jgi:chorismate mutase
MTDPTITGLREQIAGADRAILAAMNERLTLVTQVKAYKESRGVDFHDPEQEERLLRALADANAGPLSNEGLRELFKAILDLSKREVANGA